MPHGRVRTIDFTNRTHGLPATYSSGCRCDECRSAYRKRRRAQRRERRSEPVPDHVTHGLNSTYTNWGCRCGECRLAHAAVQREWYHLKSEE